MSEISMVGVYKTFRKEFQESIRKIAQKRGIGVLNVLVSTEGEIFAEYSTELERIAKGLSADFDIDPKNFFQMEEEFINEVNQFVSPGFIFVPLLSDGLTENLNRQLVDEGYDAVEPEALNLLFDEIQEMKIMPSLENKE